MYFIFFWCLKLNYTLYIILHITHSMLIGSEWTVPANLVSFVFLLCILRARLFVRNIYGRKPVSTLIKIKKCHRIWTRWLITIHITNPNLFSQEKRLWYTMRGPLKATDMFLTNCVLVTSCRWKHSSDTLFLQYIPEVKATTYRCYVTHGKIFELNKKHKKPSITN